jgi:7-cyano-7-deazaguanine synthase
MVSGGLDSTVMAYWLEGKGQAVQPLFIDYGQHTAEMELTTARRLLPASQQEDLQVARISGLVDQSSSLLVKAVDLWAVSATSEALILPYRNLMLLALGATHASSRGSTALYSAFINSNHALEIDATSSYLAGLGSLFGALGSVQLEMPFKGMSKVEVARLGLELGAPVAQTYSCQVNSQTHCGACPNCVDRIEALTSAAQ